MLSSMHAVSIVFGSGCKIENIKADATVSLGLPKLSISVYARRYFASETLQRNEKMEQRIAYENEPILPQMQRREIRL
jgi:hypothetical protein